MNKYIDETILKNAKVFENRPWGNFKVVFAGKINLDEVVMKIITVSPKEILSEQLHQLRGEQWEIISGQAEVSINNKIQTHLAGEIISFPPKTWHRIANPSETENLVFFEITNGQFDENDIERKADKYNRTSEWTNFVV